MKILYIVPFIPYENIPHAGGKFVFFLLKSLSKKHDIYLIIISKNKDRLHVEEINKYCKVILFLNSEKSLPVIIDNIYKKIVFKIKIKKVLENNDFDIVQVEYTTTAKYFPKNFKKSSSFLDAHDLNIKPARRRFEQSKGIVMKTISYINYERLKYQELMRCRKFSVIFLRSEIDEIILKKYGCFNTKIIPHPVSTFNNIKNNEFNKEPYSILFIGAMDRYVNVQSAMFFINNVMPLIRIKFPKVKFYVVGNEPPDILIDMSKSNKRVIVTGYVSNIDDYYSICSVFVAPIFIGGGVIVKILDAMNAGLPVVTTDIGNEGIKAIENKHILIANNPDDFYNRIVTLFESKNIRKTLIDNGRIFVRQKFNEDAIINNIETNYKCQIDSKEI